MKRSIIEAYFYVDEKPMVFLKWIEHAGHGKFERTLRAPINNLAPMANHELIAFAEKLIKRHENINVQGKFSTEEPDEFLRYVKELTTLSERDVDAAILDEFINVGIKCLPELIALNSLSDKKLAKYNSLFQKKRKLEITQRIEMCFGKVREMVIE